MYRKYNYWKACARITRSPFPSVVHVLSWILFLHLRRLTLVHAWLKTSVLILAGVIQLEQRHKN